MDASAKRLYVYSDSDLMVGWKDIERHAEDARKIGVNAKTRKLEGSKHVQHMLQSWESYWESVETFWKESGSN